MLLVKLTESTDGAIKAETRNRGSLGTFRNMDRGEVVQYLTKKADEIGEEIRFVDDFRPVAPGEEHVNWEKLIKKHF